MSDPKLVDCPECNASALRKQVTAARFKLKGTGWYETDFKNSGKKPEAKSAEGSSSAEGSNNGSAEGSTKSAEGSSGSTSKGNSHENAGSPAKSSSSGNKGSGAEA